MKRKSRKRLIWIIVLVLLATAALWFVLSNNQSGQGSYTEETVKAQDIHTYLSFSGHVRSSQSKQQTAKKVMKVREIYVEEGDRVEQGALILRAADGERVYADIAGTIETLYPEVDSQLGIGSPIAEIFDYAQLMVIVDADEYDVGALYVGQEVTVYINALGEVVTGAIDKIANDAAVGRDVSFYKVEIALNESGNLRAGMSVEARVLDKTAIGATTISMRALRFDAENQPFVYKRDPSGRIYVQPVTIGINDGVTVQILSGVSPGENVYRPQRGMMIMPGGMGMGGRN